ncbi:hypothetical protein CXG81DRAFT_24377 [Caulochytrium protostelioides]|uniref:CLASP N-terminal domain-containing protein n=1 Tax=Caulochytrium protostelioides TaxID=1555241 RepID=A0A4P9XCV1_9FUNG|nr:hypothetical protein CXG81DRAFT_24377 [Caulochytrium protostelioides]|eukprot:RKP02971.1 hypothetical protein CXG81DRAFT_24377 [Caulochytrium protostelioides]
MSITARSSTGRLQGASAASTTRSTVSDTASAATPRSTKVSARLTPATTNALGPRKATSPLAAAYNSGRIPIRPVHGSVRHSITWTLPLHKIDLDALVPLLFSGLSETTFPYSLLVEQGLASLLAEPGLDAAFWARQLKAAVPAVQQGLSSKDAVVTARAMTTLRHLLRAAGPPVLASMPQLVPPLGRLVFARNQDAQTTLAEMAMIGDAKTVQFIKAKVPTFTFTA